MRVKNLNGIRFDYYLDKNHFKKWDKISFDPSYEHDLLITCDYDLDKFFERLVREIDAVWEEFYSKEK